MTITLSALQKQRRDSAANWTAENPTLLAGEIGIESDTGYWKVGDGSTAWTSLAYISGLGAEIPVSRLADGVAGQIIQTDTAGTGVEWSSTANLPLGSASAPAYRFQGDTNTGIYSPGADQVAISTNGTGRLFVDASGRVLVGVSSTSGQQTGARHVFNDGSGSAFTGVSVGNPGGGLNNTDLNITAWSGSGANYFTSKFRQIGDGSLTFHTQASSSADGAGTTTERLRLDSSGRLGLGTSSPTAKFQIGSYSATVPSLTSNSGAVISTTDVGNTQINIGTDPGSPYGGWIQMRDTIANVARPILLNPLGGSVGIGTTAPNVDLEVTTSGGGTIRAARSSAPSNYIQFDADGTNGTLRTSGASTNLLFSTNGAERARIDTSGRLLVGTSSSVSIGGGTAINQIFSNSNGEFVSLHLGFNASAGASPVLALSRSRNTSYGSYTVVQSGDSLGRIRFTGDDGSDYNSIAALIEAQVDGTPGNNDMPGRLVFSTTADGASSPTERMRIDSSGRVGIGATTVTGYSSNIVHLHGSTGAELHITTGGTGTAQADGLTLYVRDTDGTAGLQMRENNALTFGTNDQERARIDSSGRLLVGTSSLAAHVRAAFRGNSFGSGVNSTVYMMRDAANPTTGQTLGVIAFTDSNEGIGAEIVVQADAAWGSNDYPGRIVLSTTADGASSPTERMRIDNLGRVGVNCTPASFARLHIQSDSDSYYPLVVDDVKTGTASATAVYFRRNAALVGTITTTNAATAYNTTSDYRLKENVVPLTGAIDRVNQLQVHRFNFIADPDKTVDGFIAHEAQAVVPECATGTKDEVDDDGNPVYQGIDQSKLVPLLTAALQEALAEIESLKARVTALEP